MQAFSLRIALCLSLATLATTTAFAGVRGKPTKLKEPVPAGRRIAQSELDYTGVNSHPVPLPADVNVTNETVIQETTVNPAAPVNDPCTTPAARTNTVYVPVPIQMPMMTPMMASPVMPPPMPMPMMGGAGCSTCGGGYGAYGYGYGGYGYGGGLSPVAAAAYNQAFGPGLYRTGAEAGQYHFPYYSYRRPWYFPGQPSFQRSTDYVW